MKPTAIDTPCSRSSKLMRSGARLTATFGACAAALLACGAPASEDLAPATPDGFSATAEGRTGIRVQWLAPVDDDGTAVVSYDLRMADEPFSAEDFPNQGVPVATPTPAQPGEAEAVLLPNVRPGAAVYVGLVAVDEVGNRSDPVFAGPVATSMEHGGSVLPQSPDDDDNAFGFQIEPGQLNGDDFADVVVAAPFKRVDTAAGAGSVYVYFGAPDGMAASPDVTLQGTEAGAQFGNAIAVLDWNGDGADDIAVGAPRGDGVNGRVYIFYGDARFSSGAVLTDADADVVVGADPASPWFSFSAIGYTMVKARFDSDTRDDLVIGAAAADSGIGAFVVLYGGTAADGDITLSEVDQGLLNGAVADVFFAPGVSQGAYTLFSAVLANLGPSPAGPDQSTDQIGAALFQDASAYVIRGRPEMPGGTGVYTLAFDSALDLQVTVDPLDPDTYFAMPMAAAVDMDGDGVRDIALASYLEGEDADDEAGEVRFISGADTGIKSAGEATIASITGAAGERFGSAIASTANAPGAADIDGDGIDDLVVVGGSGQVSLYVWYGGQDLAGALSADSADYISPGPAEFTAASPAIGGTPTFARWVGDVDGNGLYDLAWSDWAGNSRDGAIELVY